MTLIVRNIRSVEENLFEIRLGDGLALQPVSVFNEIPQDGMFMVDSGGDFLPVEDPSLITDDPYWENDGGNIVPKELI